MDVPATKKQRTRRWLYFTTNGIAVFETGTGQDKLPFFKVVASQHGDSPLTNVSKYIEWVKPHKRASMNLILGDSLYQMLQSDVPDVPEEEVESAIELKAADLISFDIDDALLDVIQLPSEAYRGRMRMAFIIACRKTPIRDWLMALVELGVQIKIIDVEITQLRNLAVFRQSVSQSGILHIKSSHSRLLLNYDSELVLSRAFDVGLSVLSAEKTIQDGELELTVTEPQQSDIELETLALEIRRSFDYYEAQLGLGTVNEILCLCHPEYRDVGAALAGKLGVRFNILAPEDFMRIATPEDIEPSDYLHVAGSAFREALA